MKTYSTELRSVRCGDRVIEYVLSRKSVKNINLRIKSDGSVNVSANPKVQIRIIEDFIGQKQEFIFQILDRFKQKSSETEACNNLKNRTFSNGDKVYIMGKEYELKVLRGGTTAQFYDKIYFEQDYLCMVVKDRTDVKHKETLFAKWLKEYSITIYNQISREVYKKFVRFGVKFPEIKIRKMTSRWGSCQPYKGIITLNSRLIDTPYICIEYVIMHEFCHFIHPDHSKDFHALMTVLMPDWKERKKILNTWKKWN